MDSCFLVRWDGLGLRRPVPSGRRKPACSGNRSGREGRLPLTTRCRTVRMRASRWVCRRRSRRRAA